MDSDRFLKQYELRLQKEFERDGEPAQWAPGNDGPRLWGSEDASITLKTDDPHKKRRLSMAGALTPDSQYLAVATDTVIRLYDVDSMEVLAELIGHQDTIKELFFAPFGGPNVDLGPHGNSAPEEAEARYILLSEGKENRREGDIIIWHINAQGRLLSRTMPFALNDMADKAVSSVSADLVEHHGLDEPAVTAIRDGFVETLKAADTRNRMNGLSKLKGHFSSFGSNPLSLDGHRVLYTTHGETTQHGMRPPEELPQIVVVDLSTMAEQCRLRGHKDAIMWAGWSPDSRHIVTASWDSYYIIWDATTGDSRHVVGPTGGQNWSGTFSPDSKHVLLSGGRPVEVAVYDLQTGNQVAKLNRDGLSLKHWIRRVSWSPHGTDIAVVNGRSALLWKPFEDTVETIFQTKSDGSMLENFFELKSVKWAEKGKTLILEGSEGTAFIYDCENNIKWRLQRPKGLELMASAYDSETFAAFERGLVLTLNGDGKVRYWRV